MIFAVGEVLIDFIAIEDADLKYVKTFEKHPGGAPANMVVGLRRLNVPSGLISKVGRDSFGEFLIEKLRGEGVETRYISYDHERNTGVVFVQLKQAEPSFLIYDNVAYFNLRIDDVDESFLDAADLLHFGGVLLAREPSRSTSLELARMARSRGIPTSFDANIRPNLWVGRMDELIRCMEEALSCADIVKLGRGEKRFLEEHGVDVESFDVKLIAVTRSGEGSELMHAGQRVSIPAYRVEAIDPTGAGDAYMAALLASLYSINKLRSLTLNEVELRLAGRFANIVAALSTTRRGAWSVPRVESLLGIEEIRPIAERLAALG
ncbi:MAG: carbohydrate kinase [Nitrososphaerota archaeon]